MNGYECHFCQYGTFDPSKFYLHLKRSHKKDIESKLGMVFFEPSDIDIQKNIDKCSELLTKLLENNAPG